MKVTPWRRDMGGYSSALSSSSSQELVLQTLSHFFPPLSWFAILFLTLLAFEKSTHGLSSPGLQPVPSGIPAHQLPLLDFLPCLLWALTSPCSPSGNAVFLLIAVVSTQSHNRCPRNTHSRKYKRMMERQTTNLQDFSIP